MARGPGDVMVSAPSRATGSERAHTGILSWRDVLADEARAQGAAAWAHANIFCVPPHALCVHSLTHAALAARTTHRMGTCRTGRTTRAQPRQSHHRPTAPRPMWRLRPLTEL